jgi:putative oxidoreductase
MFEFQKGMRERGWALLPLRLVVGFGFVTHGLAKFSRGPEQFATLLGALGMPAPSLAAWATTLFELVGGVLLMAGAFVVPLSIPLAAVMLTAMFTVHLPYGFSSIKLRAVTAAGAQFGAPGYELNLLYLAGLLTLCLGGSGVGSVDSLLWNRRKSGGRELALMLLTLTMTSTAQAAPSHPDCFANHPLTRVEEYRENHWNEGGMDTEVLGAQVFIPAEQGLTGEWLHRELALRIAARRSDAGCPLDVPGIRISIQSGGPGFWVNIIAGNSKAAQQVLERARAFVR